MQWSDQMARTSRYATIPRTLVFLRHSDSLLLLRGAPDKPIWAGKLNGLGGHIGPGEDILGAAEREVHEEAGLALVDLRLRAIVHIASPGGQPGILLFVFLGISSTTATRTGPEGELAWYPIDALPWSEMVEDLPSLLPRILAEEEDARLIYGLYSPGPSGKLRLEYRSAT